ncbi:tripartite tricarboxylate transporter TctB family protein [Falsirhodobacter sp. 20TX0035]|uniref:tripartite tricarboxylate transporter TctB family protein n=1 Tax=Falsirhodobacter sp. 20TX0035 TaxID=3022019 RepID=UPI00232B49C9|nr:tripartite tricarboxylate transporter TctB family protein [Falsirhodobacter sp. 20TX0035]MDB6455182.1 tripartite tricarboxylate transporter TctB family protein [Falsirhodobacter sp. 20TX0035]
MDRSRLGPVLVASAVLLTGIGVLWASTLIHVSPAYARIGPTVFPRIVGAALAVLGVLLLVNAFAGRWQCEATDAEEPPLDLVPLAWVAGGLVLNLLLIAQIGFILSSTLMYLLVAKGFGARRIWLAALVGFILALVAYFGFAQLLGLRMGDGLIEDLF